MIEKDHRKISVIRQCELLGISRSSLYYCPRGKSNQDIVYENRILEIYLEIPFYGYRRITRELNRKGSPIKEWQTRRLMKRMGIKALGPKRELSKPRLQDKKYPYLLKDIKASYPNHVWAADITYLRCHGAYVYLVAIMDIYSRKEVSWRLSNTLDTYFCLDALQEALAKYGKPDIFNSDQGCQFTSVAFTETLLNEGIRISMDGKGRALDNVYVERLWRSVKYEDIFLNDYQSLPELREGIKRYFEFYNWRRLHQSLDYHTPDEVYYQRPMAVAS